MSSTADDFFVMSAVVVSDTSRPRLQGRLAAIRNHLNKPAGTVLHFAKNIKEHGARVYVCRELASVADVTLVNIVMCKRHLIPGVHLTNDPGAVYLYTLRLMLERLSWIARDRGEEIIITFAHVKNFPYHRLDEYQQILQAMPTTIEWLWIRDVRIHQPNKLELLQAADIAASAARKAFQPDRHGVTEERYVRELAPLLYRRPPGNLISYGMKLHPGPAIPQFPWIPEL